MFFSVTTINFFFPEKQKARSLDPKKIFNFHFQKFFLEVVRVELYTILKQKFCRTANMKHQNFILASLNLGSKKNRNKFFSS